jgi:hypothetical protein
MPFVSTRGAASARGFGFASEPPAPKLAQYNGFASSTGSTIDISAYAANGVLCVLADNAFNLTPAGVTKVVPSGFTEIASLGSVGAGYGLRHTVSYKILNGTETTLTGQNDSVMRKIAAFFSFTSGVITTASVSSTVGQQIVNPGTLTQQTISTTGQLAPTILFGTYGTNSNRNIVGLSGYDGNPPNAASQCWIYFNLVNSGTQSATMDGPGSSYTQAMTSFFINLT